MPVGEDEDIRRALLLRDVLDQILQFEKTPCPFARTFTVELPERPQTPVKKRPWTPRKSSSQWPPSPITPVDMTPRPAVLRRESLGLIQPHKVEEPSAVDDLTSTEPETPQMVDKTQEEVANAPVQQDVVSDAKSVTAEDDGVSPQIEPDVVDLPEEQDEVDESSKVESEPEEVLEEVSEEVPEKGSIVLTPISTEEEPSPLKQVSQPEVEVIEVRPVPTKRVSTLRFLQKPETTVPPKQNESPKKPHQPEQQEFEKATPSQTLQSTDLQPRIRSDLSIADPEESSDSASKGNVFETERPAEDEIRNDSFEGAGLMRVRKGRITSFASRRAVTAPPQLTLFTSPPSKSAPKPAAITEEPMEPAEPVEAHSPTESSDSFHSVQSWHSPITPLPPSPPPSNPSSPTPTRFPYPHENVIIARTTHQRDTSESTVTPDTQRAWDNCSVGGTDPSSAIPGLPSPQDTEAVSERSGSDSGVSLEKFETAPQESTTSPKDVSSTTLESHEASPAQGTSTAVARRGSIRHRATTSMSVSHHRALSPLPPAANLFTPRAPRRFNTPSRANNRLQAIRRIPSAVIHKTCEILLAPPSHLINIMLKVAARIAAGEWRGFVFGTGDEGERVDVRWDWSDTEDGALEGWEESDFDFDSPGRGRTPSSASANSGKSQSKAKGKEPATESQEDEADPWKTPTEELGSDDWSRSWGVD